MGWDLCIDSCYSHSAQCPQRLQSCCLQFWALLDCFFCMFSDSLWHVPFHNQSCVRYFMNLPPICEKHSLDGSSVTLTLWSSTTDVWIVGSIKITKLQWGKSTVGEQLGFHPEKQKLCAYRPHRGIFLSPNQRCLDLRNPPAYERTSTMELETKPEQSVGQKQSVRTRTAQRITCKHQSIIS